jgi:hypothetical protein
MVRFTVHSLGEHQIENMVVTGPFKEIVMTMAELFLTTYVGDPQEDLDLHFARHVIAMSGGQGKILEHTPAPPEEIN